MKDWKREMDEARMKVEKSSLTEFAKREYDKAVSRNEMAQKTEKGSPALHNLLIAMEVHTSLSELALALHQDLQSLKKDDDRIV